MTQPSIRVVGHPFGPLGRSRAARCFFGSLQAARVDPGLVDVWGITPVEPAHEESLVPFVSDGFGDINIYVINGDEISSALEQLGGLPSATRNIIAPAWEMPRFPSEWAREVERFDEVWADSEFIASSLRQAVRIPVTHLTMGTNVALSMTRSRRYFGIPEHAYVYLFFFDLRSYVDRKNPQAVIEAFRRLLAKRPWAYACLVVKVHGAENAPEAASELRSAVADLGDRAVLIEQLMAEEDVHSLLHCCDAFVSLHRAEGYGLGLAEAMALGMPAIGTAYSGNMDFMTPDVSRLVDFSLVDVPAGAYPHWRDQVWADPDVEHAAAHMISLYDDPGAGRALGEKAAQHMRAHFSYRAAGLRYAARIGAILEASARRSSPARVRIGSRSLGLSEP